ncbi:hypothetical protein GDO81_016702 [Engystomops pustulosus]|uniref:Uncharacterized protein n=1 Tax=Engystomops pustulosus TaxID=76066 RepID=A0AAV7ACR2_ENGPU|nr:hypothetical protein GDO81_016702 [Engystomops pustulosus]
MPEPSATPFCILRATDGVECSGAINHELGAVRRGAMRSMRWHRQEGMRYIGTWGALLFMGANKEISE